MYVCIHTILRIFLLLHIIKTPKRSRYIVCYRFSMNIDYFAYHNWPSIFFNCRHLLSTTCYNKIFIHLKLVSSVPGIPMKCSRFSSIPFLFFLTFFQMCTRTSMWWRRQWSSTALTLASSFCLGQFVRLPIKIRRRKQPHIPKRMASNHTPVDDEKTKRKITKQETRGKQKQKPPQHP